MRTILIPALALVMGYPALAKDGRQDWKYRSHRHHGPELHQGYESRGRRDWSEHRFEHRRPRHPGHYGYAEREFRPEPVHVHPLPLPPPPPVGIHFWFGF